MTSCRPSRLLPLFAIVLPLVYPQPLFAGKDTRIKIEPGPRVMSAAEAALTPDPNAGSQHGIILVHETTRADFTSNSVVTHHLRARIFSNEGRGLADIVIPYATDSSTLQKWWGWVILPDGRSLDLPREDLKEGVMESGTLSNVAVLKGAIPGVVAGSVIDYGYEISEKGIRFSRSIPLQHHWPIKELKYRWRPWDGIASAFRAHKTASAGISTTRDADSVLVTGRNVPAIVSEPWSPAEDEIRGSLTIYYRPQLKDQKEYWEDRVGRFSRQADWFAKEKPVREAMMSMNIPATGDLQTRLKTAYDWIGTNLTNTTLRTREEIEATPDEPDKKDARTVKDLIASREGPGWQLDYLFLGIARALGAEADLVLAVDRTDHYFDPQLLSTQQLNTTLVVVRAPTESDDARVIVDAGSGLPYGQVPWWYSGVNGLVANPNTAAIIPIRPSGAMENLSQTKVVIKFNTDEPTASIHWSRTANGQSGLLDRRQIRGMTPEQRVKRLDEYCGSSGDLEVSKAEAPAIEPSTGPLTIECDMTLMNTNMDEQTGEYQFSFYGPWIEPIPEFTTATRTHPIVFSYPRADRVTIDIEVPAGFNDRTLPSGVKLDTPYGRYVLDVKPTQKGFRVERLFSLVSLGAPAAEYAALSDYLTNVRRADQTILTFRKSEAEP